ncbi:ATP-dependent serine peptidase containing a PDZ domain protein [Microbacterium mangrovi]|uniref:endopeptidase La n=1 Tax=Microbacterium mangrovi TaxID=1348253 RepID=A0A0B2A2W5_9MICO|nr:PDZ domain-containing protein [Microbacterium mangrovi]KHK97380.1 ATP-dependent serine peptidase containing a PDZ domain protein [Microbacterium mangrovi]
MALFDENVTITPAPKPPRTRRTVIGIWALVVALVAILVMSFLPTGYVIQKPGPVFNTLGTTTDASGKEVPLISIKGAETYPTAGTLDLLTVQVAGTPERTPNWLELASAWFQPSQAVVPIDSVYPPNVSSKQLNEANSAMMVDSQKEATAAALTHLGYDVHPTLQVYSLTPESASAGVLKPGDLILAANGTTVTDADALRSIVAKSAGKSVKLTIRRDGKTQDVSVTPKQQTVDGKTVWLIGVTLTTSYDFPIDVTIQLNNVGGPSAGMMFALGIVDDLTPGKLNGGRNVAGTGTITADGTVGPIGGIRQKLYGALDAGASYFLAPASNCDEVVGHVPSGLRVFSVKTLDDSLKALSAISDGGNLASLPTCTAK